MLDARASVCMYVGDETTARDGESREGEALEGSNPEEGVLK